MADAQPFVGRIGSHYRILEKLSDARCVAARRGSVLMNEQIESNHWRTPTCERTAQGINFRADAMRSVTSSCGV